MLFLHYLLFVCVQEKKESRLNSINHRIPASRKLSPPQTAIKCSVLRKWPIESMCVCVCFTWQNNRLVVFFLLEWVEDPCLWRQNKQVHSDFCSFSANGRPSEPWMSWHTERDCGFYFFFLSPLWWRMLTLQQERFQEKWLQTGIVLRENLHLLHICFCS